MRPVVPDRAESRTFHLEDISEGLVPLLRKIGSGRAFLEVVAYPWGVEFDVHEILEVSG